MQINDFRAFNGQHCETTATGSLLNQLGIELSEPMLFGLGEGIGFLFWNMKMMDFPFMGGRVKPDVLTTSICRNLNLELQVCQTTSAKKAWENCLRLLDEGKPVGLKLDCFHLEYFSQPFHFAGHYVALYGYDERMAFLVDTRQQGGTVKTSLASLAQARSEKGPMSSNNLSYSISGNFDDSILRRSLLTAINNNTSDFLNPKIKNFGYKGILKASNEVKKWFQRSNNIQRDFQTTAMLMERAGTGGALFRNLYRDFLSECHELLDLKAIGRAHAAFIGIASDWSKVADLLHQAGETEQIQYVDAASKLLADLSERERRTMVSLYSATQ